MIPIRIDSIPEYELCIERGHQPLFGSPFILPIQLRVKIQSQFKSDVAFYKWFYNNHPTQTCEEHGHPIYEYSSKFCSHILTRGAHPEMRFDARNMNLLCVPMHNLWEVGTVKQKMKMNIWLPNQKTIDLLHSEYQQLKI